MPPFLDVLVASVVSFLLGGGVWALRKTKAEAKHVEAQAETLGARTEVELHDISIGSLLKVNKALQEQVDRAWAETARERAEKEECRAALAEYAAEIAQLRSDLSTAQDAAATAQEAARVLQERLQHLIERMGDPEDEAE